jgi:hypothetical protein
MTIRNLVGLVMTGLVMLLMAGVATAATPYAHAGGYDIMRDDTTCYMGAEHEGAGDTAFLLAYQVKDRDIGESPLTLFVSNRNWSIRKDHVYTNMVIKFDDTNYTGMAAAGNKHSNGRGSLYFPIKAELTNAFLNDVARSGAIGIYREDGITIDRLDLKGSAAGVAKFRECVRTFPQRNIPVDPFKEG